MSFLGTPMDNDVVPSTAEGLADLGLLGGGSNNVQFVASELIDTDQWSAGVRVHRR